MKWKVKRTLYLLLVAHIYSLILAWLFGGVKLVYPLPYFLHFLTWWCTWNSLLTIAFIFWRTKNPHSNTYFSQIFSLVTMISNIISMVIYGLGLVIWLTTSLTTNWGITEKSTKWVPIPSHGIMEGGKVNPEQLGKVMHWWLYSPIWHLVAPTIFIYWFFRRQAKNLLKKKLSLTIFSCLIMPAAYFLYCYLRTKFSPNEHLDKPFSRWPYDFLSSKKMMKALNLGNFRFLWKILLAGFWFSLFGLIAYFSLWFSRTRNFSLGKNKKSHSH